MFKEFKEFALKGNSIELAFGVIIGGAFQSIIKSLVNDIIMPLISALFGKVDFSEWVWKIGNSTIPYGSFISAVVDFLLIALSLFLVVKYINRLNRKIEEAKKQEAEQIEKLRKKNKLFNKLIKEKKQVEEPASETVATTKLCPYCFSEINVHATRCPHCTSELEKK